MNSQDIIFGTRPVLEAIKSGKTIEKLFLQKNLSKEIFNEIKNNLKNRNVNISFVPKEKLNRITKKNHQGIICYISPITYQPPQEIIQRCYESGKDPVMMFHHKKLEQYLGVKKFRYGLAGDADRIGQVTGLAWTQTGGDLLTIEAAVVQGKGREISTGSLGDVMQESIKAAMTVLRSRSNSLGIDANFYGKKDFHFHVPEGATPKDGPSAGIGMCLAMASALTGIRVKRSVAMTGEITLRGEVLPIGGLKEKLLAAQRGGIKTVLIPQENERDLKEIPATIKTGLKIVPIKWIDEVFPIALQSLPEPLDSAQSEVDVAKKKPEESDDSDLLRRH